MVFSSPLFLFLFLPVTLLLYFVMPRAAKNAALLLASLFFYTWGERQFVWVMLLSMAMNFLFGLLVDTYREPRRLKAIMAVAIVANLGLLIAFKYTKFLAEILSGPLVALGGSPITLAPSHLPIGISFFTFHALSYVVDVYRRQARAQRDPIQIALYITLFPQLIAGADPALSRGRGPDRGADARLRLVRRGRAAVYSRFGEESPAGQHARGSGGFHLCLRAARCFPGAAWLGIVGYALQLYFDFSGYSDMAIGLGRMFGFRFPENFNYPYAASSIRDFWRRWHISLSTWFRDYLYIPLGGNRCSPARNAFNLFLVFFLCGLWHGASWAFVVWGLFHGFFLAIERSAFVRWLEKGRSSPISTRCW